MTRQRIVPLLTLTICLGLFTHVMAEGRFNMRNLNPFAKKDKPRSTSSITDQQKSGFLPKWQMPKMEMPKLKMPKLTPERKPNQPSAVQRISQSTQGVLTKTRDTLMPWAKSKKQSQPRRRRGITITPKQEKKPLFGGIFGKSEEPKLPTTPNEFLSQPQLR